MSLCSMVACNSERFLDSMITRSDSFGASRRRGRRTRFSSRSSTSSSCIDSHTSTNKHSIHNSPPRKPKRTHVTFASCNSLNEDDTAVTHSIPSSTPLPLLQLLWYTKDEYEVMNLSLSQKEKQQRQYVSTIRTNFVNCILELQEEQRYTTTFNYFYHHNDPKKEESLANHSKTCSKLATMDAIQRAKDIAKQVVDGTNQLEHDEYEDDSDHFVTKDEEEDVDFCKSIIESVLDIVSDDDGLFDSFDDDFNVNDVVSTASSVTLPTPLVIYTKPSALVT